MARILYGVSGEGSGHSSRARVVARYLESAGHHVVITSYDRGLANLREDFEVVPIEGLTIGVDEGRVSYRRTLIENARRLPAGLRGVARLRRAWRELEPEIVLTDFEPTCAYLALQAGVPLVSVDNQHRMRYMQLDLPPELEGPARRTRAVIRAMVPRPDACVATTFFFGPVRDERLQLVPPILRDEVRSARAMDGGKVLVYATKAIEPLLEQLGQRTEQPFVVYGFPAGRSVPDHIELRAPSREGFLEDLRASRAVIATAGFTLMTECLHLGKPLYALPLEGQFEQELNALWLERMGCGWDGRARGLAGLGPFLESTERFRGALDAYDSGEPEALFAGLESAMELAARGARGS